MAEQELYGQAGVEASQNFHPMPAETPAADQSKDISSRTSDLRDASDSLPGDSRLREAEEISYRDRQGKPTDPHLTLKKERAAEDLARFREARQKAEEQEALAALRQEVDQNKRNDFKPNQSAPQPQPQNYRQQDQAAPQPSYARDEQGYTAHDRQIAAGARDPQVWADVQYSRQVHSDRIDQLHREIGNLEFAGGDTTALKQELASREHEWQQACFVERAQQLMHSGAHPEVAAALASSRVLDAWHKTVSLYEAAAREKSTQMERGFWELANVVEALTEHNFPEFKNARTGPEKRALLDYIRRTDPAKAAFIEQHINAFDAVTRNAMQLREQNERLKQEDLQNYRMQEATAFRAEHPEFHSPDVQHNVANAVVEMLEHDGLSKEEIVHLYNTDRLFNSRVTQKILYRALKNFRAEKTLPTKRQRPGPVQTLRPGNAETHLEPRVEEMPEEMTAKQAARILQNRRAARGRR